MSKTQIQEKTGNRGFYDLPPWLLGLALLSIVALVGVLYASNSDFSCGKVDSKFECGFKKPSSYEEKLFNGYFYTLDDKGKTVCAEEELKIKFFDDKISLSAYAEGVVHDHNGSLIKRTWTYQGYRHGNDLALSYVTADSLPTGNGIYYLLSRGGDYAGYWMGTDFPTDARVQCPYVLTKMKKRGNERCEELWPKIFSSETECRQLHR